ncbi:MAG: hypothetical protein OHK0039_10070 [Bacteroidia bacterium]
MKQTFIPSFAPAWLDLSQQLAPCAGLPVRTRLYASALRRLLAPALGSRLAAAEGLLCDGDVSAWVSVLIYDSSYTPVYQEGHVVMPQWASVRAIIQVDDGQTEPGDQILDLQTLAMHWADAHPGQSLVVGWLADATRDTQGLADAAWETDDSYPHLYSLSASLGDTEALQTLLALCLDHIGAQQELSLAVPVLNRAIGAQDSWQHHEISLPLSKAQRSSRAKGAHTGIQLAEEQADESGHYALHRAVLDDQPRLLRDRLAAGAATEVKNKQGDTPLHLACRHNRQEMALALIEAGADVNSRNHVYASPLHVAIEYGHNELATRLIEHGAELEARNNRAYTPLHKAAMLGNTDAARLLLAQGADIHARMERDIQPLHLAAWYGQTELAQLLIAAGADCNATNADGNTPLHFAAFNGQVKIIKVLIASGADTTRRNDVGERYLQGINEGYRGEMIRVLE